MVIFSFPLFERQVANNRQYAKKECLSANSKGKLYYFFNISKYLTELLLFVCCLIISPFHNLTIVSRCEGYRIRAVPATYTHAWQAKTIHCERDYLRVERGRNERP